MHRWTRHLSWPLVALGGVLSVGAPARAADDLFDQGHIGAGRVWYDTYCTPCHGRGGGPGSAVHQGSTRPVDLRTYVARNSGLFPAHAWYAVVENVDLTAPHAEVWQRIRRDQAAIVAHGAAARGVVTLIADYVRSVQTK